MQADGKATIEELREHVARQRPVRDAAADLSVTPRLKFDTDMETLIREVEKYVQWKKELKNVDA